MSTYGEKLRDPRWQKMRLEIMQRDEFCCQKCFDSSSTLNVHHRYYVAGAAPWEYPADALVTLCEDCHSQESEGRRESEGELLKALHAAGAMNSQLIDLAVIFASARLLEVDWSTLTEYLALAFGQTTENSLRPNGAEWERIEVACSAIWHARAKEKILG